MHSSRNIAFNIPRGSKESQCNSDQSSDLGKNSDQHHQNFHSPRGTNPSNDCTASYVFPDLEHDNGNKAFPENQYKRPVLFHAKVVSIGKMEFHLFQKTK